MGGCAEITDKYYSIIYKGLKNPQMMVLQDKPRINPLQIPKDDGIFIEWRNRRIQGNRPNNSSCMT